MASTNEWFETVAEARRRARRRLPRSVFLALEAGSEKGTTLHDNVAAFSELGLAPPRIADRPATRAMATSVLGQDISLPVIASPTGVQAVHPEGEVAVARGAAEAGTAMGLSSFASVAVEEVVAANPKTFFQLFWIGDRDRNLARVQRARDAGAKALIVTLDWSFATARDWGSPPIPETMNLQTMLRFAPEGLTRPGYVLSWLRHGRLPELTVPNMSTPRGIPAVLFRRVRRVDADPPAVVGGHRLAARAMGWPVHGEGRHAPRRRAAGGRRRRDRHLRVQPRRQRPGRHPGLDPGPARGRRRRWRAGRGAAGRGIRRGSDVVKALALGARAVMIGRAYLWGLAANGSAGVRNVFDILRGGIDSALLGLGRASIHDLGPEDVLVPPGFTRGLGQ